ncbi:MAG: ADP-glyceromanno-heptose 6-epimerase [Bacteroidales bacterium]|nr:ADP-glyceromanno-heptose 6-epimerase [Bacteroidales bacterium]
MSKIVVTGAAGFIGSCLVGKLNNKGYKDIILVDDFSHPEKENNYIHKAYLEKVDRDLFSGWIENHANEVEFVFHMGARTDTTESDRSVFDKLNLNYSKSVWNACVRHGIRLIYASSAATYGMGELGYDDDHRIVEKLRPLNLYGESKNDFDKWVLSQHQSPQFWAGIKFFNVYGPNEYHKGRMASVIFHAYHQIMKTGMVRLFRSHNPDFKDGEQLRDFIFVRDVIDVLFFLFKRGEQSGLYNLGTAKARTFLDLARATFHALDFPENIVFIDTPADIRDKYQYFTEARMEKLRSAGYDNSFYSLEEGIEEYVVEFLKNERYF